MQSVDPVCPMADSILGRIITVPDEVEDFRRWISATFPSPEPAGEEPPTWPEEETDREATVGRQPQDAEVTLLDQRTAVAEKTRLSF